MVSAVRTAGSIGRNDPCPCGSGRKYKRCHGAEAAPARAPASSSPAAGRAALAGWFRLAVEAFERDDDRAAADHARRIVGVEPDNVDAINLLGIIACRQGRYGVSNELLNRAIELRPKEAQFVMNLGNALREEGRFESAIDAFGKALRLDPTLTDVHFNLGMAYAELDRHPEAIAAFERFLGPGADGHTVWRLGGTLREQGRWPEAVHFHAAAAAALHDLPEALHDHGMALVEAGRPHEALPILTRVVERMPDSVELHNSLGTMYFDLDDLDAAQASFEAGLALDANAAEVHFNLGRVLLRRGAHVDAVRAMAHACELKPTLHTAQWTLGQLQLLLGQYAEGWKRHEARLDDPKAAILSHRLKRERWDGSPLEGRRIMLHAEQGIGDSIQFMRYAPLVAARGGRVMVLCQRPVQPLFRSLPYLEAVIALGEPLPEFDCYAPLMSLPLLFGTMLDTIPADIPYLFAEPEKVTQWRARVAALPGLKVGIAWAGNPDYRADARRSLPFDLLGPLAGIAGVTFVSLQKGPAVSQADAASGGLPLQRFDAELTDFSETAALMMNLDLVLSVDTAVAHLAGALGRPTWLFNRHDTDWRWQLDRCDSPWYPSLRVFRQPAPGQWAGVVEQVRSALESEVEGATDAATV